MSNPTRYDDVARIGAAPTSLLRRPLHTLQPLRQSLIGMTIDRSSSMRPLAEVAVRSFNELIEQQKLSVTESRFTLTLFNDQISTIHDGVPLREVPTGSA